MTNRILELLDETVATYARITADAKADLTTLDTITGDGDFGENISGGLCAAMQVPAVTNVGGRWQALATVFLDEVGGTSGPLFGLLFSKIYEQASTGTNSDPVAFLAQGLQEGLKAIQRVGEAQIGDRTLVDALAPGTDELLASLDLKSATSAAIAGAESTRSLVARMGRSSYVGDRAIGVPDPGAVAVAMLFTAFSSNLYGDEFFSDELSALLTTS